MNCFFRIPHVVGFYQVDKFSFRGESGAKTLYPFRWIYAYSDFHKVFPFKNINISLREMAFSIFVSLCFISVFSVVKNWIASLRSQ